MKSSSFDVPGGEMATQPFTDEELTALAMAAEPVTSLDDDAVAWDGGVNRPPSLLPN